MKRCPQCKNAMKPWIYDIGAGILVRCQHCTECGFNVTPPAVLQRALGRLRDLLRKEVRVVAIGEGLGVRFPSSLVKSYKIRKGRKVTIKPGKRGLEVLF